MSVSIEIRDNSGQFFSELKNKVPKALETIGLTAEGYAKRLCPVGTPESTGIKGYIGGTLRNSITHALDGESAAISEYTDNAGNDKGSYSGTAPQNSALSRSVYIGTNVEYAPYVEMGTSRTRAKPFIQPAVTGHGGEYKQIVEREMKG